MKKYLFASLLFLSVNMAYASPFAYVTNYGADNISIFDLSTNAATGFVNNNGFDITNPVDIKHSPDGTKAYLLADSNNALFVIDTSSDTITSEVDSSSFPFNAPNVVRFSPDGTKAYIINEGSNNVSIVDATTDTITGYVNDPDSTMNLPISVVFSTDGSTAYVVNYNAASVSIVDVASDTVTGILDNNGFSLDQPCYMNVIDDTKGYVTSLNNSEVAIIDLNAQQITGLVNPGSFSFFLPFSLYATSDFATEFALDAGLAQGYTWPSSTDTVANASTGFSAPRFVAISADNSTAYVSDLGSNSVFMVDMASNTITGTVDGSVFPFNEPFAVSISP